MAITVNGPEGVTVNFPDGTDAVTIDKVMRQHFGAGGEAPVVDGDYAGGSFGSGLLRSIGQGVLLGFGDEAAAGVRSMVGKETYDEAVKDERAKLKAFRKQHPVLSTTAEIASGFATPGLGLLSGAIKPAASTLGSMAKGAGLGVGLGAVAGAGAGDEDRLAGARQGATFGLLVGPVAPFAGKALSAGIDKAADILGPTLARAGARLPGSKSTPAEAAADAVMIRDLRAEGLTPATARKRLADAERSGTFHGGGDTASVTELPIGLIDVSPGYQRLGGSVVRASKETGGRAEAFIGTRQTGVTPQGDRAKVLAAEGGLPSRNPLAPREADAPPMGQMERIEDALHRAFTIKDKDYHKFGANAYLTEKAMTKALKEEADKLYGVMRADSAGYDVLPHIEKLIKDLADEAKRVPVGEAGLIKKFLRQFTTGDGSWIGSVDDFDKAKRQVDRILEKMRASGDRTGERLMTIWKNDFIKAVDSITHNGIGKKYAAARDYYSSQMELKDALDWGRKALREGSDASADQFAAFTGGQRKLARLGIADGFKQSAMDRKRTADLTQQLETPRAQELLRVTVPRSDRKSAVFADRPERVGDFLANEKTFITTRDKVLGNSATAGRMMDDERLTRQTLSQMFDRFKSGNLGLVPMVLEATSAGLTRIFGFREDVAREIGRRLFTAKPAEVERIIARLEARWGVDKVGALTRFIENAALAAAGAIPAAAARAGAEGRQRQDLLPARVGP